MGGQDVSEILTFNKRTVAPLNSLRWFLRNILKDRHSSKLIAKLQEMVLIQSQGDISTTSPEWSETNGPRSLLKTA
jgi:hypothetical protein